MDAVASLFGGRLVATHCGLYNPVSGIAIALGNLADTSAGQPRLLWRALSGVGAACPPP
ncbi:hypothetical protein [Streptomyces hokutonensis]|uniref:hypothetical protein n=1 Tax=Streptomyces hokutonensis TaxID=1306990 RepID=UPI003692D2FD